MHLLVVDDNADVRAYLDDLLRGYGHNITLAANGQEGIEAARKYQPDVVLLDLNMPEMDGLEVVQHLRENRCSAQVIVLLAQYSADIAESALSLGADDFLVKPLHESLLLAKLSLLERVLRGSGEVGLLRALIGQVMDGVIAVNANGAIAQANEAAEQMFDAPYTELLGQPISHFIIDDTLAERAVENVPLQRAFESTPIEVTGRRSTGEEFYAEARRGILMLGNISYIVLLLRDITEQKRTQAQVTFLAHHDFLTGLPNKKTFSDRLQHAIHLADRTSSKAALLLIDLDFFKQVNDRLGHQEGDAVLKSVAEQLKACVRDIDVVARIGGDEFAAVLYNLDGGNPALVAQRMIDALARSGLGRNAGKTVGASIGIACYPDDGQDVAALIATADTAMYRAKASGRNQFCCASDALNQQLKNSAN